MNQYIITDEAIQDLKDISEYFLQNNLEAGESFLKHFNARCHQLVSFPNLGRSYSHIRKDLRGLTLRGFILIYRVTQRNNSISIEILRIVNGRRNLAEVFSED